MNSKINIRESQYDKNKALRDKDFDKVLDKYSGMKKPFYKNGKFYLGMGVVLVVIATLLFFFPQEEPKPKYSNLSYEQPYSQSSVEMLHDSTYFIVLKKGRSTSFTTPAGSKVTIPSNALVDKYGEAVSGEIEVHFREILNQRDIFLSGIPMHIDDNGKLKNFESAGMFEILAYQDGEPLFIKEGKSVEVALASNQLGNYFNQYYLNPKTGKWEYKGVDPSGYDIASIRKADSMVAALPLSDSLKTVKVKQVTLKKLKDYMKKRSPKKPVEANPKQPAIQIEVDYTDFPELSIYKGIRFQIAEGETNFDPSYANQKWNKVEVEKVDKGQYEICFEKPPKLLEGDTLDRVSEKICFLTEPVVNSGNYDEAIKEYERRFEIYSAKKDSIQDRIDENKEQIYKTSGLLESEKRQFLRDMKAMEQAETTDKVLREFSINKFGIWNCDYPEKFPSEIEVTPQFVDEKGESVKLERVYLVEADRNIVYSTNLKNFEGKLKMDKGKRYMLWAAVPGTRSFAVAGKEQFENINSGGKMYIKVQNIKAKKFSKLSLDELMDV